jgi:hypothetical protein
MNYAVRSVDAVLLIAVGALMTLVLQVQGYRDVGTIPFFVGLVGACIAWVEG